MTIQFVSPVPRTVLLDISEDRCAFLVPCATIILVEDEYFYFCIAKKKEFICFMCSFIKPHNIYMYAFMSN